MARKRNTPNFERALEEFEQLVTRMEEGDLTLEESLKTYERGMALSRKCQAALADAEQRVQMITEQQADAQPPPQPDEEG